MTEQPSSLKNQPVTLGVLVIIVFLVCWACARFLPFQSKTLLELFVTYYTWYWLPPLVVLLIVFRQDALDVWDERAVTLDVERHHGANVVVEPLPVVRAPAGVVRDDAAQELAALGEGRLLEGETVA